MLLSAQCYLIDSNVERPEWVSYQKLVQDLITGVPRRHTFTPWELQFLLDLHESGMRKSCRDSALRKYLRMVHQNLLEGAAEPTRLSTFLAAEIKPQNDPGGKVVA